VGYALVMAPEVRAWLHDLRHRDRASAILVGQAIGMLLEAGPELGRPLADRIRHSRLSSRPAPVLYVHPTAYRYDGDADPSRPGGMTTIYRHLAADEQRARQVIADVLAALSKDRNCLILTSRTSHLEKFAGLLREAGHDPVILRGGMGAKSRAAALARLQPQPGGPCSWSWPPARTLAKASTARPWIPRPKSTTTSMSGLASSPLCSPNARLATPVSASATRAGSRSLQAPARTANRLRKPHDITLM